MTPETTPRATVELVLPWVPMTLDQTEQMAALIPDSLLDWRLPDPSGRWHFSLAEIAMHCADARRMFARQLSGDDSSEGYWGSPPKEDGTWEFRTYGSKEAILADLKEARTELRPYLDRPAEAITETTPGIAKLFEATLTRLREQGTDVTAMETRGPANIVRVLMAVAVHESGHRSSLQTLLRMHGINPVRE